MDYKKIIATFDQIANMPNSGITKLPVIPNTKGTYKAQYCVNNGLTSGYVKVFRVYENDYKPQPRLLGVYYLKYDRKDCKNMNSSNHRIRIDSKEQLLMLIIKALGNTTLDNASSKEKINIFINNIKALAKEKENPFHKLEYVIEKITGKKVKIDQSRNKNFMSYYSTSSCTSHKEALESVHTLLNYINDFGYNK
jgi:hypothetical protein